MTEATITTQKKSCATGARYRRGSTYIQELCVYIQALADPQREFLLHRVQRIMVQAMRREVTLREIEYLELYFVQGYTYGQISRELHVNISTISRTVRRGEKKIDRVLTFAKDLLGYPYLSL